MNGLLKTSLVGLAFGALGLWYLWEDVPQTAPSLSALPMPPGVDLARGEALYAASCAVCHGTNLEGQPDWQTPDENGVFPAPPHNEDGHTWHHGNDLLFDYIKFGGAEAMARAGIGDFASGMPPFEGVLSDPEIWDILAFIQSTWSPRIKEIQRARSEDQQL